MKAIGQDNPRSCYVPRLSEETCEKAKFFIAASVMLWVPTLLYCAVIGGVPFYSMMLIQASGIALGVWLYKRATPHFDSGLLFA